MPVLFLGLDQKNPVFAFLTVATDGFFSFQNINGLDVVGIQVGQRFGVGRRDRQLFTVNDVQRLSVCVRCSGRNGYVGLFYGVLVRGFFAGGQTSQ